MRAYEINEFGIENLSITERKMPVPQANEVVVKFHAASLNFRDLMMVKGVYDPEVRRPLVPFSDGAGEVVEIGSEVTRWKVGDRVMPAFMQDWIDGAIDYRKAKTALGGDLDGCLREYGAFREAGLVPIPGHLTYEEAATLPCAGVTAWNALRVSGKLAKGDKVLLLGTGGVSIFALQFAKNVGAETIITSSSDDKLEMAGTLGATHTINYKTNPDWDEEVLELTGKRGVDHIVEVGGAGTLQKSINCVRMGGHIAVIGVLAGKGGFDPISILMKAVRLQGIFVGSRVMFEDMAEMIRNEYIKPVVTKVFEFDDAREALSMMESGDHFGKIVVKVGG
ncbi:MAG: NAD(P)-dependent alcohol dehydrogenase [Pyrinomonadaceae bacterium]|nr:NAD(P)-dependent alcohol dehydrogenase [Pyrinomonadaceae bacterium]